MRTSFYQSPNNKISWLVAMAAVVTMAAIASMVAKL